MMHICTQQLNLKIEEDRTSKLISFSQEAYIDEILTQFNLQGSKTHITPIDPNICLSKDQCSLTDEDKAAMSKIPYREAIGSLMWAAVVTQPDIAFPVSLLSQFLEKFGRNSLESSQESHEISEWDEELQVNPQKIL